MSRLVAYISVWAEACWLLLKEPLVIHVLGGAVSQQFIRVGRQVSTNLKDSDLVPVSDPRLLSNRHRACRSQLCLPGAHRPLIACRKACSMGQGNYPPPKEPLEVYKLYEAQC